MTTRVLENANDLKRSAHPVLIAGEWRASAQIAIFQSRDPRAGHLLPDVYPVSGWDDIEAALASASRAAVVLRGLPNAENVIAAFLEGYAKRIEEEAERITAAAAAETALPLTPRLKDVELPRTTGQLRQAAHAAREGSWLRPTIDTQTGIRSCLAPIGPVWVLGPNNFPLAFNGIAGGDFAAAIAAGNPVIAKAHPLHPSTSRLLAELANEAAAAAGLPPGTIQMVYDMRPEDGFRMIADARLKAVGFTGSRSAGLKLKNAADAAGKKFFGEMSSINPVVILPGALAESLDAIVTQLTSSILAATGQMCTKPGLVCLLKGEDTEHFIGKVSLQFKTMPPGVLFSETERLSLLRVVDLLHQGGAELLTGGGNIPGVAISAQNSLLRVSAAQFLRNTALFQTEAFGNASLIVVADSLAELRNVLAALHGSLTGSIYSSKSDADDAAYEELAADLRPRVGRFLNDKMPTGVAVTAAMNHGGPFPATSEPHFTSVGLPAAILRFTQLECFDNVREQRLPLCLRRENPTGKMWRLIDGCWTQARF
ncbi:MAG TPA: aldehyde dehydrogenase family protein [Phycisphaerae bacterium]|nr:aldehyde dehydrogenase family protein [Phycisphaerae bacterium]